MIALAALRRLMHTSTVGGVSLTGETAEQVSPALPCGPSVATTVTAVTAFERASRNAMALMGSVCNSAYDTACLLCAGPSCLGGKILDSTAPLHQQRDGMHTIPSRDEGDIELHHLQILDVLLKERSLTKAANMLDLTQPGISKTLARLRRYFDDPLFIRVAQRMEPTPKAMELAEPVRAILERMRTLRSDHTAFDPKTSDRTFKFFMVDAGVVQMLPPLLRFLQLKAPQMHVQAIRCDLQHLDLWLESGPVDFPGGSFTALRNGIRRHPLWTETYAAVARKGHPRLGASPAAGTFLPQKHPPR